MKANHERIFESKKVGLNHMLKTKGTDKITGKTNLLNGFFNGIKKFLPPPSLQTTVRKKRHGHLLAKNPKTLR